MPNIAIEYSKDLFKKTFKEEIQSIAPLPPSGSARKYFRIKSAEHSIIAAFNSDIKENKAFLYFSELFKQKQANVPEVYAINSEQNCYLLEDIGNETLYDRLIKRRKSKSFPDDLLALYKNTVEQLADIQIKAGGSADYSRCYPREAFDEQSVIWDLNYFKYNFLKLADILFDEQNLENDFNAFTAYLMQAERNYFLYRDFQSRNIMLHKDKIYFIDFQGGRKGALHYDLASLLYDAKANIPEDKREEIKMHYLNYIQKNYQIDTSDFDTYYYAYVLIRIMQAMGAYGFRGLYEKKTHFIESIPFGLKNLKQVLDKINIPIELPELMRVLTELANTKKFESGSIGKLNVRIKSFSYKRGIPYDKSGNGGGFVFDCRFIENPGRLPEYKELCGKDQAVINFLENRSQTQEFLDSIFRITSSAVSNYQARNFSELAINFGCTGGQHRSVFFAEKTAEFLKKSFQINVELKHTEGF